MASTIIAQPNMSMANLILAACGTMEGTIAFCEANDVSLSDATVAGQSYVVPDGITTDAAVLRYWKDNNIVPGNANLGVCGLATVVMGAVGSTTAAATLTAGTGATAMEWAVLPIAMPAPESGTTVGVGPVEVTMEGLAMESNYHVWVRTICWGSVSDWISEAFATTAVVPLSAEVILYPRQREAVGYSAPNYFMRLSKFGTNFICTKGLAATFADVNKMWVCGFSNYTSFGGSEAVYLSALETSMTVGVATYNVTAAPVPGDRNIYWGDISDFTHTFTDIDGNSAITRPMVMVNEAYDTSWLMQPEITVAVVLATEETVKLRLTRSHAEVSAAGVNMEAMHWGGTMGVLSEDPENPGNNNIRLATLGPGVYTVQVTAIYNDGYNPLPDSIMECVVEIS